MTAIPITDDPMPIVRDLATFDRNSGNWLERLVFNHRLALVVVCAIATATARLRCGHPARAEREF